MPSRPTCARLFQKFHIEDLPQNQKRTKLVERAFALGIVSRRDL